MVPTTTRRYLFHANACAFGGRIVRPRPVVILSDACSAVGVSGGHSESQVKARHFRPYVSIGSASTVVDARFDDVKRAKALTNGEGREEDLTSTSSAKAVVERIAIGSAKRVVIGQVTAGLRGSSVPDHDEPSIVLGPGTGVRGCVIDGCPLAVDVDFELFEQLATYTDFVKAGSPGCVGDKRPVEGGPKSPVLTTIVKSLRWTKREPKTARIEGLTVKVDDFGRIHFGELLVEGDSRRLTMMRLRLGSPEGGSVDFAEVQSNGSWYPPII
jgi:hypothetical protein